MSHILDNMIWQAISTGNRDLALLDAEVGCYRPDIAPFAAVKEKDRQSFDKLHSFLDPGRKIAISYLDALELDETKWTTLQHMDCCQMIYEYPVSSFKTKNSSQVIPLGTEHIPEMLELTALTKPGPFLQNTILFGNYFGIYQDGRLAGMTGQRMHPVPYLEVSAVCTHPDFRGRGYAKTLMLHVMQIILDNGFIPFLHVLANNTTAIGLYESIGFRTRRRLFIDVVKRLNHIGG
jgi:ribosomal protein S18 acetylase RimI-like enzyme